MDEQEQQNEVKEEQQEEQNVQMEPTPLSSSSSHKNLIIGIVAGFVLIVAGIAGAYFVFHQPLEIKELEVKEVSEITPILKEPVIDLIELSARPFPSEIGSRGYDIEFTWDPLSFPSSLSLWVFKGEECGSVSAGYGQGLLNSFEFGKGITQVTKTFPSLTAGSKVCAQLWDGFYEEKVASNPLIITVGTTQDENVKKETEEITILPKITYIPQKPAYESPNDIYEWSTYSARSWYDFSFSYPSKWVLKPVSLLHGRMFLELEHDIKSDNGDPVARIFLNASRFGGGQVLDEWHTENLDELMTPDWLVGSVDDQQNISTNDILVKGVGAIEQKNNISTGWSRSTFVPSRRSILAVHLLGVGASLNSVDYNVINNFYDAIINKLAFFKGDFSDEELARYEEIITEIGEQNIECNAATPGIIDIIFHKTTSVAEVKDFVANTLFNLYGFEELDMFDLNFGNTLYQWLFEEDSPYLSIEYSVTEEKDEGMFGIRDRLGSDSRVKNVYYEGAPGDSYSLGGSKTIGVEFYSEALPKDFLSDYPGFILLPSDIRILYNYYFDRATLSPTIKPFGIKTLSDDITLIDAFKKQLSIESPSDAFYITFIENSTYPSGPRFTIVFPHQYSFADIQEFIQKIAGENFSYKGPNRIAQSIYVGVGNEEKWTKTLSSNSLIEKIELPELACMSY